MGAGETVETNCAWSHSPKGTSASKAFRLLDVTGELLNLAAIQKVMRSLRFPAQRARNGTSDSTKLRTRISAMRRKSQRVPRPSWRREREQADRIERSLERIARRSARSWPQSALAVLFTLGVAYYVPLWLAQPDVAVIGVRPVHEFGPEGPDRKDEGFPAPIYHHTLGFIFELHNSGGSEAFVHDARIEGCVPIDWLTAASVLDQEGKGPTDMSERHDEYKNARQRIQMTGAPVRNAVVPSHGSSFVAIEFPFRSGGYVVHGTRDAISKSGDCSELTNWMTNPDARAVLNFGNRPTRNAAQGLLPAFQTGDVVLSIFVGDQVLTAHPDQITRLARVRWPSWRDLSYPEFYRDPSASYYQRSPEANR